MSEQSVAQVYSRPGSNRRNLIIFFLILVCGALLSTIIYLDHRLRSEHGALTLLDRNDASEITIHHAGERMELRKEARGWVLDTNDTETLIDAARVAPLLSLLQLPESSRYHIDDVDLQSLGLTEESTRLTINDIALSLGKPANGNRRYVRADETIFLAPDIAYQMISAGAQAFVGTATESSERNIVSAD